MSQFQLDKAISEGVPLQIIRSMVEENPSLILLPGIGGGNVAEFVISKDSPHYSIADRAELLLLFFTLSKPIIGLFNGEGLSVMHILVGKREFDSQQIVEKIVRDRPEAASVCSFEGELPLHVALKCNAPASLVQALVDAYPRGVKEKSMLSELPLHLALLNRAGEFITQRLLNLYPEASSTPNGDGSLPIHLAVQSDTYSLEFLEKLLDLNPKCGEVKDNQGNLPLHYALQCGSHEDIVVRLLFSYTAAAKMVNSSGQLPLQIACSRNSTLSVIASLVSVDKDAVLTRNASELTPVDLLIQNKSDLYSAVEQSEILLHFFCTCPSVSSAMNQLGQTAFHRLISCRRFDEEKLAERILAMKPIVATVESKDGELPLHLVLQSKAPDSLVLSLIESFPEGVRVKDRSKDLPLHFALREGASESIVMKLIEVYPDGCSLQNREGEFPIHYALRASRNFSIVSALLKLSPRCAEIRDKKANYPLHYALEHFACQGVIGQLLTLYPDATKKQNSKGSFPLHDAVARGLSVPIISLLVDANKEMIVTPDKEGMTALDFIFQHSSTVYSVEQQCEIIYLMLLANSCAGLCQNSMGLCPIHILLSKKEPAWDDLLVRLLDKAPSLASFSSRDGDIPLHYALQVKAADSVIFALLAANPASAQVKDNFQKIPLHYALRHGKENLVEKLLDAYPDGVVVEDKNGDFPMQIALQSRSSDRILSLILSKNSAVASSKNRQGKYPVHCAVENDVSVEIVRPLCEAYSVALASYSVEGNCPFPMMCGKPRYHMLCIELLTKSKVLSSVICPYDGDCGLHKLLSSRQVHFEEESPSFALFQKYLDVCDVATLTLRNNAGNCPLSCYILDGSGSNIESYAPRVVQLYLQGCPNIVDETFADGTLLKSAISRNLTGAIGELIAWGAPLLDDASNQPLYDMRAQQNDSLLQVMSDVRFEGWLMKKGGPLGIYRKRWFRILRTSSSVVYYVDRPDKSLMGSIGLRQVKVVPKTDMGPCYFELQCGSRRKPCILQATSAKEVSDWIMHFQTAIDS